LLAQLAGAIVGGLLFALLGYLGIGYALSPLQIGMGLLALQFFAAIIGFGLGAGLGTHLVGRAVGSRGNVWLAMAAAAVTAVVVILVMRLLNVGGLAGLFWVGLPLSLLAALVAYNLGRR
jgi:hypothetical protein